jgi:hypothetical protein
LPAGSSIGKDAVRPDPQRPPLLPEEAIRELASASQPPGDTVCRLSRAEQAQVRRLLDAAITGRCPVKAGRAFDELVYRLAALRLRIDRDAADRQPG